MVLIFKTCTIILFFGTHKKNMRHFGTDTKLLIMNKLKVKQLKMLNQDNNQDMLSRLSETRANSPKFFLSLHYDFS